MKKELQNVQISQATEHNVTEDGQVVSKILLVTVPFPSLKATQKHLLVLLKELEKRRGVITFIVGRRAIQSKWIKIHKSQKRPRNRTLTAVHDAVLEDLIYPANITGRRVRYTGRKTPFYRM